jgi:hypothetical protein
MITYFNVNSNSVFKIILSLNPFYHLQLQEGPSDKQLNSLNLIATSRELLQTKNFMFLWSEIRNICRDFV